MCALYFLHLYNLLYCLVLMPVLGLLCYGRKFMSILDKRLVYSPFEYPQAHEFWIQQQSAHWTHYEIQLGPDVQDWKEKLTDTEKSVIGRTLKGFTQAEVLVEDYWSTKITRWFKKPEIQMMASSFASMECFDQETELLTSNGWIKCSDLSYNHEIAQYCIETKKITFVNPIKIHSYQYAGKMHLYKGSRTDLCVTPNHKLITINPHTRKVTKRESGDSVLGGNFLYPCTGFGAESGKLSLKERLLIAIQADGSIFGLCPSTLDKRRDVVFNLKKKNKIDRLISILDELGYTYFRRNKASSPGFEVISFELPDDVDIHQIKNLKFINLKDLSPEKASEIIEEALRWDASDMRSIYNTNEEAIDKLQACAALSGKYTVTKGLNRSAESSKMMPLPQGRKPISTKNCYLLTVSKGHEKTFPKRKEVDYEGPVYCVSVPFENVICRRSGKVAITGNSVHSASYAYLQETLGLNDFDAFLYEPSAKAKIDRLLSTRGKTREDIALSLAVFSAFTEGVNLFSSFAILLSFSRKNLLKGVGQIVSYSLKDESLHARGGCWLFRALISEFPEILTEELKIKIYEAARVTVQLEDDFIDQSFQECEIDTINSRDLKTYIRFRTNTKLKDLGLRPIYLNLDKDRLANLEWFSVLSSGVELQDFFANKVSSYSKGVADFSEVWS